MRSGQPNRTTDRDNSQLILRRLLDIKRRREKRLRRLSLELNRQYAQIQQEVKQNQDSRENLLAVIAEKMQWSGVVSANEVLGYKREMERLYQDERYQFTSEQALRHDLEQIQQQREKVNTELTIIMKKQEKLRMLLEDDAYQN